MSQSKQRSQASTGSQRRITKTEAFQKETNSNLLLDGYSLLLKLGEGSYGRVIMVRQKKTQKYYAMKYVDKRHSPAVLKTIIEERKVLGKIRHPFICNLRYGFQEESFFCLILDLASASDLRHQLLKSKFSEDTIRIWIAELACAVEYLHSRNIVHRDIKPENILMSAEGHVKLADFNVARELTPERPLLNGVSGTFNYMAPEMHLQEQYGEMVDWWALGIVFYECVYQRVPFKVKVRAEMLDCIFKGLESPTCEPPVTSECNTAIELFLKIDPLDRVSSTSELFSSKFFHNINRYELENLSQERDSIIVSTNADKNVLQMTTSETVFHDIGNCKPFSKEELRREFVIWYRKKKQKAREAKERQQQMENILAQEVSNNSKKLKGTNPSINPQVESSKQVEDDAKVKHVRAKSCHPVESGRFDFHGTEHLTVDGDYQSSDRLRRHPFSNKKIKSFLDPLKLYPCTKHYRARKAASKMLVTQYFPGDEQMERGFRKALPPMDENAPNYSAKMSVLKAKFELQEQFDPFDYTNPNHSTNLGYNFTTPGAVELCVSTGSFTLVPKTSSRIQSDTLDTPKSSNNEGTTLASGDASIPAK